MRVGVFLAGFDPERGGGYTFRSDVFRAFATEAASSHHTFVALCDSDTASEFAVACGVQTVRVATHAARERLRDVLKRELPISRRWLRGPSRIERAAKKAGVQLVWYLDGGVYEAMDLPYIATVWDLMHRSHPWFPEVSSSGLWYGRDEATRFFLQRAAYVIVGTDAGAEEVREFYRVPAARLRKLPHPTPSYALHAAASQDKARVVQLGLEEPFLLYPAQFWPHKNHATLVLALARLRDKHNRPMQLALAGSDKGTLSYVRHLAKAHGLDSQVSFLGFVSQDDLIALYRRASALVYPSFCGPENLPPLEAFALGCPVIAADIPGAREQLEDAAILVDPGDPGKFADAINRLLSDQEFAQRLINRGRARAARWTGREFVRGIFAILDAFEGVRRSWADQ